jgi:hypothetical protein
MSRSHSSLTASGRQRRMELEQGALNQLINFNNQQTRIFPCTDMPLRLNFKSIAGLGDG